MAEKQEENKQGESKEVEVEVEVENPPTDDEIEEAVTPTLQPQPAPNNPNNFLGNVIHIVAQQQGVPLLQPAQNNPMFQQHQNLINTQGGRNAPQP